MNSFPVPFWEYQTNQDGALMIRVRIETEIGIMRVLSHSPENTTGTACKLRCCGSFKVIGTQVQLDTQALMHLTYTRFYLSVPEAGCYNTIYAKTLLGTHSMQRYFVIQKCRRRKNRKAKFY